MYSGIDLQRLVDSDLRLTRPVSPDSSEVRRAAGIIDAYAKNIVALAVQCRMGGGHSAVMDRFRKIHLKVLEEIKEWQERSNPSSDSSVVAHALLEYMTRAESLGKVYI